MDLFRKVRTQEEKNALLKEAREEWEKVPPEFRHLVADSAEDYLEKVASCIEVEPQPFTPARPLTVAELAVFDGELMFSRIFGDRADSSATGISALDELAAEQEREAFEKLAGPARRSESLFQSLVRQALEKVLEKRTIPMRESERPGLEIHPVMHEMAHDDSDAGRFIRAWIANDTAGMREIAHSLAAA
jgi:hypothetical protein